MMLEMMLTTVEARVLLIFATFTSSSTFFTTSDACGSTVKSRDAGEGRSFSTDGHTHLIDGQVAAGEVDELHGDLGGVFFKEHTAAVSFC